MTLASFLDSKPLFYDEIDYDRFPRIYAKLKEFLPTPKIVHFIGTNGKGTTGRFLFNALWRAGYRVMHYTSPHIAKFNERIHIDAKDVSDEALDLAHSELLGLLDPQDLDALSYFEYTTLLAMLLAKECDFVVLEAGLGGEHDATAVFSKVLSIVTPISFDHESFLGSSIKEIALTKLRSVQNSAILAEQKHSEVYKVAEDLQARSNGKLEFIKHRDLLDSSDEKLIEKLSINLHLAPYLAHNLSVAISALKHLGVPYDESSFDAPLFGRLTRIASNVIIDVGHNPLAASSIAEALKGERCSLIYNTYGDKNYREILSLLCPIIDEVLIIDIEGNKRVEEGAKLSRAIAELGITSSRLTHLEDEKNYLVFGSFSVVESFLKNYYPTKSI